MDDFSYELAGLSFGRGTAYKIQSVDFGETGTDSGTVPMPRSDGVRFGRDYFRGRTITFTGNILTNRELPGDQVAAPNALEELVDAWSADDVRLTPGAVIPLRMYRNGRVRRVYGRPSRISSTTGKTTRGWIPFVAEFNCADHLFYDDAELVEVVPIVPTSIGGLEGELIGPIIASPAGEGSGTINVQGTKPSWLVYEIHGPIIDPVVEVTGRWKAKLNLTLFSDQFVLVDPTPWARTVRRDDGSNRSGAFSSDSARLSQMRVYPGANQVLLRGVDLTGTASIKAYWRDTYSSY